jgi:uncharacterized membrane protein YccC
VLQRAVDGLLAVSAAWRTVAVHLMLRPYEEARREAELVLRTLPQELRAAPRDGEPARWMADPTRLRQLCEAAVRRLVALPAGTPSLRLLADHAAEALAGMSRALNGLALLVDDPARPVPRRGRIRLRVPDLAPALVNAGRAFVTIGVVELFWIVTAWPSGAGAITFAAIVVTLFAPRAEQAAATAMGFMIGIGLATVFAAIMNFAVLPGVETFVGFSIALGLYLVPAGALMAQPWQAATFTAMASLFVPLLSPTNQMSYDTQQFYNQSLAIIAGVGAATLSFRLVPPLSPAFRTRRLLALTRRDLRRLARASIPRTPDEWESRVYGRLSVLPDAAEPVQRSQLVAALSVGSEIIQLRGIARRLDFSPDLEAALAAIAQGNSALANERLTRLDQALASWPGGGPQTPAALRARGSILAVAQTLTRHADYFDAGGWG